MSELMMLYDWIWITNNCWNFENNSWRKYYGNEYNTSEELRFTTFIENEYFDCGIDTEMLAVFSKYANLRLVFVVPDVTNTGKLGTKYNGKWFNGSMALLHGNYNMAERSDYLIDDTYLSPDIYEDIEWTHVIDEDFQIALAMRKFSTINTINKLYEQFDSAFWICAHVSLLLVSAIISLDQYLKHGKDNKISYMSYLASELFYNLGLTLGLSRPTYSLRRLFAFWLFVSLLSSESYKTVILSNLINGQKKWFSTIRELANAPKDYTIYIPENTPTYHRLMSYAYDSSNPESIHFETVLKRVKTQEWYKFHDGSMGFELCDGNVGALFTSKKVENANVLQRLCDLSLNDMKYDQFNIVRLIRNDYPHSARIAYLSNIVIESGVDRHWYALEKTVIPLLLRTLVSLSSERFAHHRNSHHLSLSIIGFNFLILIIGLCVAFLVLIIELTAIKLKSSQSKLKSKTLRRVSFGSYLYRVSFRLDKRFI